MSKHICETVCVEHFQEDEILCPYCLYEFSDSWELLGIGKESGQAECYECEQEFNYGTTITYEDGGVASIYYTTTKMEAV